MPNDHQPAPPSGDPGTPARQSAPLSDEEIVRLVGERALAYYADGQFSCAEAILKAFAELFTPHLFDPERITRLATPFNGGFSELQQTCGVLTGGMMAIGMITGRDRPGDEFAKEQAYTLTQIFYRRYLDEIGTTSCRELLTRWKDQGPDKPDCKAHTRRMAEMLARTILQVGFHDLHPDEEE